MDEHSQHGWEDTPPEQQQDFVSTPNVARTDKDLIVKDFYKFTNTEFANLKGQRIARTVVSGNVYSASTSDFLIAVTSITSTTVIIGLPRAKLVGVGKTYIVKDEVGGAASTTISIRSQDGEFIDGATNLALNVNFDSWRFYTDGSNWFTVF